MKKFKRSWVFIILAVSFILCSCQKDTTKVISSELLTHVTKTFDENIKMNADIIFPEKIQSEVEILEIELKKMDEQTIINKLYPDAVALDDRDGVYSVGDSFIDIDDGNFYYEDKSKRIYSRFFVKQEELLFPNATNLEELNVDESLDEAKKYLAEIGFGNIELTNYYVLNKQFLEGQYNKAKKEKNWQADVDAGREVFKEDWQEEKGAYIFNFSLIEHDLPIVQGMYVTKDDEYIHGSSITICCNENGVNFVEAVKTYSIIASDGSKKLAGTDVVIKGIEQKFSNLIIEEPITINKMRLAYQVQKIDDRLYLVPVWEVQYFQQNEGIMENGLIYYDVETGKELVLYEQ